MKASQDWRGTVIVPKAILTPGYGLQHVRVRTTGEILINLL